MQMRTRILSVVLSVVFFMPSLAQTNADSIKAMMDKIEITNPGMKQVIENYKKGVIKGDLDSETSLGLECISGKYVKPDVTMGLILLEDAANQNHVDAQYNLGNLYYGLWAKNPNNNTYFSQGVKWLRKAVRAADNRSVLLLSRYYYDYGMYKKEMSYIDGSIKMLETYPAVTEVSVKDDQVLNAQALLGTAHLSKWRLENDTTALLNAKKWYRILLKSDLYFPNYTPYIDSLKAVLSMGVPVRIDPQPTPEEIEQSQNSGGMGGFGGMPMGGRPGGRGGMPAQPQGPQRPQAKFVGGGQAMQQFIRSNTLYPENLKSQKLNGRVTINFTIDTDGAVINPQIAQEAEVFFMNQDAMRVVMIMPDWIPAETEDGKVVQANSSATVTYGSGGGMGGFGFGF